MSNATYLMDGDSYFGCCENLAELFQQQGQRYAWAKTGEERQAIKRSLNSTLRVFIRVTGERQAPLSPLRDRQLAQYLRNLYPSPGPRGCLADMQATPQTDRVVKGYRPRRILFTCIV